MNAAHGGDHVPRAARDQQNALILVVGAGLVFAGVLTSSAVDPEYDPLLFGVGLVMAAYAIIAFTYDRMRGLTPGD